MPIETFVKESLCGIAKGVQEANETLGREKEKPAFVLKRSGSYQRQESGCVWFDLALGVEGDTLSVLSKQQKTEALHKVGFNVAQAYVGIL
ncbi:MAG: hypothetical protein A2542_03705 [Parcubacteria group bacterium RIFOXYD2_FULL_52_8]|nr:MAG: hypothetical protein A2542_03705 [Parcubacteria group bacterium RIFOXYD2_FULL_52_8]